MRHLDGSLFSFNLFAINAADFEKIRRLHVEYYQRIRDSIASSSEPDRVVLMNLQLLPLATRAPAVGEGAGGAKLNNRE